jgi:VanZ family protein
LPVDTIYINKHLRRYSRRDFKYKLSKNVEEFLKVKDYKEFLNRRDSVLYDFLKKSKNERDKFEHQLSQIISHKKIEKVLNKADKLKFPPMDFY